MYAEINPLLYYDTSKIDDSGNFYSKDCGYVLENILKEYNACICQADAKWVIYRPEETKDIFDYREFTPSGVYSSNGSINPLVYIKSATETSRIVWRENSGTLTMMPSYGKFIVTQILHKRGSLLPSHGFELWNVVPTANPFQHFFQGWNISINVGSPITWGFEDVKRENSNGALFVKFGEGSTTSPPYKEVLLSTIGNPISFKAEDILKISFDYRIDALYSLEWVMLEFKVKMGSYYLRPDGTWLTIDEGYIELYPNTFNQFQTHTMTVSTPGNTTATDSTIEFYFRLNNGGFTNGDTDYDIPYLKGITTTSLDTGTKRVVYAQSTGIYLPEGRYYYELETGDDAESFPDVIRPDDWTSVTNNKIWVLKSNDDIIQSVYAVNSILIDNAIVNYLPDRSESPELQESIITVNTNNKRTLEVEILQGDCPTNITNANNTYDSYITYNGDLTNAWTRDGLTESDFIQRILLRSVISQFQKSARRLSGTLVSDITMVPYSCVVETMDSNRLYQTQGLEIELKENDHTIDLYELRDVEASSSGGGGGVTPFSNAFSSVQFGQDFD
jgi:hypothetical protein